MLLQNLMSLFWFCYIVLHTVGLSSAQTVTLTSNVEQNGRQAACPGDRVTFTCKVTNARCLKWTAEPFISDQITFLPHDNPGPESTEIFGQFRAILSKVKILSNNPLLVDFTSTLIVTASEPLEGTVVQCLATTDISMIKTLTLAAPPSPPQQPSFFISQCHLNNFTVAVHWERPANDGGVGINASIRYTVSTKVSRTILDNRLIATFTLSYNEMHMVSITASNCAGKSNASVVTIPEVSWGNPLCTVGCGPPTPPRNGYLRNLTSSQEGTVVTFECNPGLVPSQQTMSVCMANGSWIPDPAELVCNMPATPVSGDCGVPASPTNGTVNYTTTTEGSQATFQCRTDLVPGEMMTAVCEDSGGINRWSLDPGNLTCSKPKPNGGAPSESSDPAVVIAVAMVVVAVSVGVVITVIIIVTCWRKRRGSGNPDLKVTAVPKHVYDYVDVTSPEMYPLADSLYDQPDAAKQTPLPLEGKAEEARAEEEYNQLQRKKPPKAVQYINDPTYSHLQTDQATGGDVYSIVNKKPPPVPLNITDNHNHSQLKDDQATGGDVYSVVNKKPPPVPHYVDDDPNHSQDPATGGDVYSVVNKKPRNVPPKVDDDPSYSQLKQDQATGGGVYSVVNKNPTPVPPFAVDDSNYYQLEQDQATSGEVNQGPDWKPGCSKKQSSATDLL